MNYLHKIIRSYKILLLIFSIGFIIRLLFLLFFAEKLLGTGMYINGDTFGWIESFKNLWNHGKYTFDLTNKEAYFGRVPGFAFFWGVHYLVFGEALAYKAVAYSQLILDSCCILLLYGIAWRMLKDRKVALISASLYAIYPFIIYWVTVSYSEILANSLNLLLFFILLKENKRYYHFLILGLLSATCFLTREFVALNLLALFLFVFLLQNTSFAKKLTYIAFVSLGFLSLYLSWPIRNYINHDRIILGRTWGGFGQAGIDFRNFHSWVTCWDNDEMYWLDQVLEKKGAVTFPKEIFQNDAEEKYAQKIATDALNCGASFNVLSKNLKGFPSTDGSDCTKEVALGFDSLKWSYIKNNTFSYLTIVPLKNIYKIIFKNNLAQRSMVQTNSSILTIAIFSFRTFLILAGLIGCLLLYKTRPSYPIILFCALLYFFFCFIFRTIEMRNLVYAEVLMLIPAAYAIRLLFKKISTPSL